MEAKKWGPWKLRRMSPLREKWRDVSMKRPEPTKAESNTKTVEEREAQTLHGVPAREEEEVILR